LPSFLIKRINQLDPATEEVEDAINRVASTADRNFDTVKKMLYGNLDYVNVRDEGLIGDKLVPGTIQETQIGDNAIITPKLAANAVTADKIESNTITAEQIAASTITSELIVAEGLSDEAIAGSEYWNAKFDDDTVVDTWDGQQITMGDLRQDAVKGDTIIAGGYLKTDLIEAGTITADKLYVNELSAISANIGNITAGTVTGILFRTAESGQRVEITSANTVDFYDFYGDDAGNIYGASTTWGPAMELSCGTDDAKITLAYGSIRLWCSYNGPVYFDTRAVMQDVDVGDLYADGTVDFDDATAVYFNNNLDAFGNSDFQDITASGDLEVGGETELDDLIINGDINTPGASTSWRSIDEFCMPYFASNMCYIDAADTHIRVRDANGNTLGDISYD